MKERPSLYLIPTPLGNLDDITIRGLKTLEMVDVLFCEDTRETKKLLSKYNIQNKLVSCHEFNEEKMKDRVLSYLSGGFNVGIVTDQGTPLISDPGYKITSLVVSNGYDIVSLPGPTAFVPALTVSLLAPHPFLFYGFLNSKTSKLEHELEELKDFKYTLIFYESPHRIIGTLNSLKKVFGNRKISISREISKIYEEIYRGNIDEVISELDGEIKGEFVIIVEGNKDIFNYNDINVVDHIKNYINLGYSEKEAMKLVARDRKTTKSEIYKEYHKGCE